MDKRDWQTRNNENNGFHHDKMEIEKVYMNQDGDEDVLVLSAKYVCCDLCEGKGSHVNPDIDRNGLTREDFDDDPDFRENYFNGAYDVPCNKCSGLRVILVADETKNSKEEMELYCFILKEEEIERREMAREARYGY